MNDHEPYDPFLNDSFAKDLCFLCGVILNKQNKTVEHIFPQWLIRQFHLNRKGSINISVDEAFAEVNKNKYGKILIPCCRKCNSEVLAPIENKVKQNLIIARDEDYDLSDRDLFLWSAKIFYGLYLYEHLNNRFNLKGDGSSDLVRFRTIFLFLQLCRFDVEIKGNFFFRYVHRAGGFPASIMVFNVKLPRDVEHQFDFKDDWIQECMYLRVGKKAILMAFDGGYLLHHGSHIFSPYIDKLLHPAQMEELAANFFHMAELRTNIFRFIKSYQGNKIILDYDGINPTLPVPLNYSAIFTGRPFLGAEDFQNNEFDERYASILAHFTRTTLTDIYPGNGMVHTWLRSADSPDFLNINIEDTH